jgi:hypothetical protein
MMSLAVRGISATTTLVPSDFLSSGLIGNAARDREALGVSQPLGIVMYPQDTITSAASVAKNRAAFVGGCHPELTAIEAPSPPHAA